MRLVVDSKYVGLKPFLSQLADDGWFDRHGGILHDGRNTIKRFDAEGCSLAVKRFGHLSILNRMIYGTLRRSKAMRAYLHAGRLRALGIDTPEAVAVVEIRRYGLLRTSYFVALHTDYRPLPPVLESFVRQPSAVKPLLDALAGFLFRLHRAGVLHLDLNQGNILYRYDEADGYRFQLIDTNRMRFRRRLSLRKRLENLRRLSCEASAYLYILRRYAEISRTDPSGVQLRGVLMRLFFESRQSFKLRLKRWRSGCMRRNGGPSGKAG